MRTIRGLGGFAIVAGSMLGIGIFLSPPIVATYVDSPTAFLVVWGLGGLVSLAGAVACAELGTMMPRAGGDYVFQYEAFGASVAFASGCVLFTAIFCGSIATMAVGLCTYQLPVLIGMDLSGSVLELPWGEVTGAQLAALTLIPILTGINAMGVGLSARTQTLLTVLPIVLLTAMALYAIAIGGEAAQAATVAAPRLTLSGIVVGYMAVYFAYSGWINVVYVAGEVEEPQRNIPFALISGVLVVTILYVLLCAGFIRVLGMEGLRTAGEAGTATAAVLGGDLGRTVITLLIASALLASINGTVLGGARVAFAMALRGALWPLLGTVGPYSHVPHRALWLQAGISGVLILSGRFEQLYTMVSLAMVVTGALTVGSLFVLRRTRPDTPRPYRATAYPWLPALYLLASGLTLGVMVHEALSGEPGAWYPLLGVGILVAAYVLHRSLLASRRA